MSALLGAGLAPAGTSAAGFGSPATGSLPVEPVSATPAIDPTLRDYTYDGNGNRVQGTTAQQRVYLACLTVLESSSVIGFGLAPTPRTISDRYVQERTDAYARAFAPLTADGVAVLLSIQINRFSAVRTIETIRWRDLTTLEDHATEF